MITRAIANLIILVGLFLLVKILYGAATGSLTAKFFTASPVLWTTHVFALILALAIPLHIISVGLLIQKRWLSPSWRRIAWIAVVFSGCWLGVALVVQLLIISPK